MDESLGCLICHLVESLKHVFKVGDCGVDGFIVPFRKNRVQKIVQGLQFF